MGSFACVSRSPQVLLKQGKLDEAEAFAREDLEESQKRLGSDHPDTLVSLSNLAQLLVRKGERK